MNKKLRGLIDRFIAIFDRRSEEFIDINKINILRKVCFNLLMKNIKCI